MINFSSITALKSIAKVSDIVGQFYKLKKVGNDLVTCCPFHNEKSPSFKIPKNNEFYKCFGCGKSGDVFTFLMEDQKMSFNDAVKYVANFYKFDLEIEVKEYVKPIERIEKIDKDFIDYFEKRAISNYTLLRFKISQCKEWMPKANSEVRALCFNYYRDEKIVNIKFRAAQKDFKLAKDAELIFYNLDSIKDTNDCVIVEGEIDCLSMYEAGVYNCVSVPNGASLKGTVKLQYLDNCYQYFHNKEKIILALDNDAAGEKLKDEFIRRFGSEKCHIIDYPKDCKDANEILVKYGKTTLNEIVTNAKQLPIEGIVETNDIEKDIFEFYSNGYPKGTTIGIEGLDEHLQLMPGQFTTVTGIPGSGKSEFVDFIIAKTSLNSDWRWAVCSFENSPPSLHATKILEKIIGKAFDFRKDIENRISQYELELGTNYINKFFSFINVNEVNVTLDGLLEKAAELVRRIGINGLLIDPWNYIEHQIPFGQSETQYISDCLTKIKKFAAKYQIHIIIVAHPTKLQKDKSTGKYEVPTLYSISGSAHFFNKTDNGFCVFRDFQTGIVDIHIQKVRYSWLGKIGCLSYNFNTLTRQYTYING